MTERRFTDREVGLILKRAVELEDRSPSETLPAARGFTLEELQEVAREAGIDPAMVGRAAAELDRRRGLEPVSLLGPSGAKREVRVLPGKLESEAAAELMRVVDDEVEGQGTVVEALGGVRWTSTGRFLNTQVSVEPSGDDTLLRVEEHFSDSVRVPLHGVPAGWGLILGLPLGIETLNLVLPLVIVLAGILAMVGWGVGDLIWRQLAAGSRRRVGRLAETLTDQAQLMLPEADGGSGLDEGEGRRAQTILRENG